MTDTKTFKERIWTEDIQGELDEFGFFYTPNGSFWDTDYVYFNREGFDKHGGRYNDDLEYIPGPGWDSNKFCYQDENSHSLPNIDDLLLDDLDEEDDYYDPNDELGDECYDGLDEYDLEYQGYNTHQHDNRPYEVITEKKTVSYLDSKEDKKPDVKSNCTTKTATLKDGPKDPEMKLSTETEEGVTTKKSKLHSLFGDDKPVPKKDTKKAEEKKPSPQESKPKEPEVNPRESVKNQTLNQNTTSIQSSTNSFHEENDNRNAKTSVNYQGNKSYSKGNKFDKNTQQANNYYNNPNPMMYAQSNQYVPNYSMNNQYPNFPMGGMSSYSNMQMNPNFNMNMQPNMYQAYNLMQMQNMNPTMQQDSRVGPQGDSRYNVNNSNKSQRR